MLGVIAHQRGNNARAETLIRRAIAIHAGDAGYHNNLGTVLLALGRPAAAIEALARAVSLKPAYAEAHNNLGNAYQNVGDLNAAIAAYNKALAFRPEYAEAHNNLGRALHTAGNLDAAVASYRRALGHQPGYINARKNLGDILAELGRVEHAETQYREALKTDPANADVQAALAAVWERTNRLEEALAAAEGALKAAPTHVRGAVMAARCERRLGRLDVARTRLEAIAEASLDDASRAFVAFEMATLQDRLGDYRAAFRCFALGNRMIAQSPQARSIDPKAFPNTIRHIAQRFGREWVASWTPPVPYPGISPVFLIGFPRSGTTLLDQVLNAHPALTTMEEKPAIDAVKQVLEARPDGYPEVLAQLDPDDIAVLRQVYFAEVAKHVSGAETRIVVDKMPLNTIDAGLIWRLFPAARIILALRHPCDVVLSGFMQAFRPNPAMVHFATLKGTAKLYAQVMGLWQQYAELLPLPVLTTRYEDLVADFAGETRRILDFLGLPWDDAVLSYRERAKVRAIATPSYHQVVQPLYTRSIGRWRNYAKAMTPVLPLLRPFAEAFGYTLGPGPEEADGD